MTQDNHWTPMTEREAIASMLLEHYASGDFDHLYEWIDDVRSPSGKESQPSQDMMELDLANAEVLEKALKKYSKEVYDAMSSDGPSLIDMLAAEGVLERLGFKFDTK